MYSLAIFNVLYLDYPLILTCVTYSCDKQPSKENLRKAQFGFQLMREVVARRPHGSRLSHTSTVCQICSQEVAVLVPSFVSSVLRTPAQGVELPMFPVGISPQLNFSRVIPIDTSRNMLPWGFQTQLRVKINHPVPNTYFKIDCIYRN